LNSTVWKLPFHCGTLAHCPAIDLKFCLAIAKASTASALTINGEFVLNGRTSNVEIVD